ncbi:VOC family protein [Microbacterium sp. BK668]|uniref:VOC family protein n=1 Tax=Microbacterium sp. BK668 TaxID=2512118 RepID=UPI0010D77199|nr:hypothetical protein EV279_3176 [Microbacterium sp. BK668]
MGAPASGGCDAEVLGALVASGGASGASAAMPCRAAAGHEHRESRSLPSASPPEYRLAGAGEQRQEDEIIFENARGAAVVAASDLARARSFYEGVLGLTANDEFPDQDEAVFYELAGTPLMVYATSYAGTAKNTVFVIETDDLARDMAALRGKGVEFLEYDFPGLKTVDGVAELSGERSAWFADSEGNILALSERT